MNEQLPPAWLADEEEVCALLHKVLDRFDAQPGTERHRSAFLSIQRCLPSLERGDAEADRLWSRIRELESVGIGSIRTKRNLNPLDPDWHDAKVAFAPDIEPTLRAWLQRPATERAMQSWRRAVLDRAHAFTGDVTTLLARRIVIPGRTDTEVVAALEQATSMHGPMSLRQLSTRLFWGDSKVLDERGDLIAALLPQLQLRERPIVAAVHLPLTLHGVLFIENQDSYALASAGSRPDFESLALVYAAGFRGAATRIRSREGALLHYAGPGLELHRADFERWWHDESADDTPRWFWGDLDFAGMQILKALRARFGDVQAWRPGYEPMIAALRASPAHATNDRGQIDPGTTGCAYADEVLLPAIRQFGCLDQEW